MDAPSVRIVPEGVARRVGFGGWGRGWLDPPGVGADGHLVWTIATTFSSEGWLLLSAAAGSGVLAMLYTLASYVRNNTHVHDLHVRVNSLRIEYQCRLKELEEKAESGAANFQEVEVVEPVQKKAA